MEFNAKYVHFMWDSKLDGVKAFCANDIDQLKHYVEFNDTGWMGYIHFSFEKSNPFAVEDDDRHFKFVYYDPYYRFKKAIENGETIEAFSEFGNIWFELDNNPNWDLDPSRYRIKSKDKPAENNVTNRELARWLVQGKGEYCTFSDEVSTVWTYKRGEDDQTIDSLAVHIRKWDSNEWLPLTKANLWL